MAYRIKKGDASVQDAMRRIADEQLGRALDEIDDANLDYAEKVHQVRKRCKKLRGLVRLVRPAFHGYEVENRAFRDAARLISGMRDARTLIQTYDAVTAHFEDRIDRRDFAAIRARLTRDANRMRRDPETQDRMQRFRSEMKAARKRAATWTLTDDGFDAIAGGLGRTHKRARLQMQKAWSIRDDTALHDWRKRVKYHWYHTRLVGGTLPAMMDPHADAFDDLSDVLGDHHDLAVLEARLRDAPEDFGASADLDAFGALIRDRKETLCDHAFALGRVALAERNKALVKRWGGYWSAWTSGEDGRIVIKP